MLVGGCAVLTACEAPRPDVTFYGNRTAVETGPTRWCTVDEAAETVTCAETDPRTSQTDDRPRATGPDQRAGRDRTTPWAVYFRYLDEDGKLADGRSEIFTDGQLAYTLRSL